MEKVEDFDFAEIESYLSINEMEYLGGSVSISYFNEDEKIEMGHSIIYIFQLDDWIRVLDRADSISGDVLFVIESLYKTVEADNMYGGLMIIDEMSMNNNIDSFETRIKFLEKIMDYVELLGIENIGFMNRAICKNTDNSGKYMNKYISLGFRPILMEGSNYFILVKNNEYL